MMNKIVVCGVIVKEGKVLCLKRGDMGDFPNKWEFPGGKVEGNETNEEALKRELFEELNVKIKVDGLIDVINYQYENFSVTLYFYLCELISDAVTLNVHLDGKWLGLDELNNIDFLDANYKVFNKVKEIIKIEKDKSDINELLNKSFNSTDCYNLCIRIQNDNDYKTYIVIFKAKYNMNGFKKYYQLNLNEKKQLLRMLNDALNACECECLIKRIKRNKDILK